MLINENLRQNDLDYMVSSTISIDQYTSKIDDDNITVAFFVKENDAINELKDFIEKYYFIEIRDIEVADTLTKDNQYILFVEFERNVIFTKILLDMIDSITNLVNNKKWYFETFGSKEKYELNEKNINNYVRLSKLRDNIDINEKEEVEESKKYFELNDNGFIRRYLNEGYISKNKFDKLISESLSVNNRDIYELKLFENSFPDYDIITSDENIFLLKNNKIMMLSEI